MTDDPKYPRIWRYDCYASLNYGAISLRKLMEIVQEGILVETEGTWRNLELNTTSSSYNDPEIIGERLETDKEYIARVTALKKKAERAEIKKKSEKEKRYEEFLKLSEEFGNGNS